MLFCVITSGKAAKKTVSHQLPKEVAPAEQLMKKRKTRRLLIEASSFMLSGKTGANFKEGKMIEVKIGKEIRVDGRELNGAVLRQIRMELIIKNPKYNQGDQKNEHIRQVKQQGYTHS
ncbi:hypothetical protein PRVXT_002485 [Proteinivorax tanatarense]|uniref:Uncharacterized protein n=1 Tax=Proteinivorax tanatarense TaxID=1260629 RepID=A0AAU7VK77_9FIRM